MKPDYSHNSHQSHSFTEKFRAALEKLGVKLEADHEANSEEMESKKSRQPYTIVEDM